MTTAHRDQQLAVQVDPGTADPDRSITGRALLDWLKTEGMSRL